MSLCELIEKNLKLKLLKDFGALYPRSIMMEAYSEDPGLIGDGDILKETVSYRIQLVYSDKTLLDRDVRTIKNLLRNLSDCSLPRCEKSSDVKNKKWIAAIYFEMEGEV